MRIAALLALAITTLVTHTIRASDLEIYEASAAPGLARARPRERHRGEENVQATAADLRAPKPRFTALRATAYFAIAVVGVFATLSTVAGLDRLENWHNALPGRLINDGRQFPLATWRDP
ncbi:MAG TPA: hypothetical protein PLW10_12355, partial [Myxococcota bacterium]|nr:hypothetical protein [Myxococcota bacterium]